MEEKQKTPDIGVVLNEDADNVEVLFEGYDIRNFILQIAVAEADGVHSEEVMSHLRELYNSFENPLRQRYEIRACVWKNRYAAANEEPPKEEM